MYLFYKVGSRNEYQGITGLSHFLNIWCLMVQKVWSKTIWPNNGIQWRANNAYTTENVTVYTDWFPASAAAVIFDLEADRISSLSIDPSIVESEEVLY
jgi:predicted Zn-dependent peptidase